MSPSGAPLNSLRILTLPNSPDVPKPAWNGHLSCLNPPSHGVLSAQLGKRVVHGLARVRSGDEPDTRDGRNDVDDSEETFDSRCECEREGLSVSDWSAYRPNRC